MSKVENPLPEVNCPGCQTSVRVSVPRNSEIVSVNLGEMASPLSQPNGEQVRKQIEKECCQDHRLTVVYDW